MIMFCFFFFCSSRRRHTRSDRDWSSDVCSSDLRSPALVADHYDSTSGLTLTASRADLLKTLAQSRPRSYGAGDTFLTVPYRPILPRLDCHAWLSVRRPERVLFAVGVKWL